MSLNIINGISKCLLYRPSAYLINLSEVSTTVITGENYIQKNRRLQRPLSPCLAVYKFELPGLMSITHRVSGAVMSGTLAGFAIGITVLPYSYPECINWISSWHFSSPLFFVAKAVIAWPFVYHSCNGLRHLAWDLGKGFDMPVLYKSGYVIQALSILLTLSLASI